MILWARMRAKGGVRTDLQHPMFASLWIDYDDTETECMSALTPSVQILPVLMRACVVCACAYGS